MTIGPTLPPGQIETKRFPIVGERSPSHELSDPQRWRLEIVGLVHHPISLDLDTFLTRADRELVFDIHCVTSWTRFGARWTGLPLRDLLAEAKPLEDARFVSFEAYSERGHHTSLPLSLARDDCWLVHAFEGAPLEVGHGGPVRVVTPSRYFYKSLKWVKRIALLAEDRPGWWEAGSFYHNNADPWAGDERFTSGSIRPDQVARFVAAPNYDKYRGRVMMGLDLRAWVPSSLDLRRLYLKNCDLRGVSLPGADMRESNLSLSDLRGADLRRANLAGSDLEGVNFAGADLSEADLSGSALSATRFVDGSGAAHLEGAIFEDSFGLVEEQEEFVGRTP
ncbi:MAG TPA: molybdopterin-dependent oxidoreductase [Acidimicrobiia bacterium]|nr:molybdopterin-dependent oxidoreductase [Acidimicrobiia bacterium]